jgi:hypothetical protein
MHYSIIALTEKTQQMPNTKASNGGQKITVKFVCQRNGTWNNRAEIRIVFHHDMVYITEIRYNERFVRDDRFHGHMEKSNFAKPIKNAYPFDTFVHGYTYDGRSLEPIAMADIALKMYRNMYIYFHSNGNKYLMDI